MKYKIERWTSESIYISSCRSLIRKNQELCKGKPKSCRARNTLRPRTVL